LVGESRPLGLIWDADFCLRLVLYDATLVFHP
jgi:hypothetical protein